MAHIHGVFDSDTHFVIDPITRHLKNETSKKASVVQFDHDSERFTFELPRIIEGHDMTTCNVVQVHYLNIDAKTKKENKGLYEVDDLQISPEDENTVICSWLISQNATQLDGSISFLVRFSCVTEGEPKYIWQTAPYTAITVTTGIDNSDYVAEEYADILQQWKQELEELAASGGGLKKVTWEDIENKPFGEVKHYPDVICDETATDRVITNTKEFYGQQMYYVKVGDLPTTSSEYLSKLNSFIDSDDKIYTMTDAGITKLTDATAVTVQNIPFIIGVDKENIVIDNITFPVSGLYFLHTEYQGGNTLGVQKATFKGIIPLDEKYMPESYNELKEGIEQLQEEIENATPSDYEDVKETVASNAENISELQNKLHLPAVTKEDKGKFARVNDKGEWVAETVPNAKGVAF